MFDRYLLPQLKPVLEPVAKAFAGRGLTANGVTAIGFGIGLLNLPLLAIGQYRLALLAIVLNRVLDGLDGAMARLAKPTEAGAFLDIAFDFFFYATVPLGFALADASNAIAAATLLVAFVGTGSSFLAYAAIAAKLGKNAANYPHKGIYYLGGLTEGAETIALFVVMCLWPTQFPLLAFGFAALCGLTTLMRWWRGYADFKN